MRDATGTSGEEPPVDESDAQRRRVEALRTLAAEQPQASSSAPEATDRQPSSLRQRRRPLRWLLVSARGVALIAAIGAAVIRLQPRPAVTRPAAPDVQAIDLAETGAFCPHETQRSPDGAQL